jgi:putative redox protein
MPGRLTATLNQEGLSTSRATVRQHTVYVDRPVVKGGADRGPAGGEYILVGLGGCFTSHLLAAIAAHKADIGGVSVSVSGTLNGTPERFTSFELIVSAASGDFDALSRMVAIAEQSCQVTSTLKLAAPVIMKIEGRSEQAAI